jgi:hypothetical protein
MVSAKSKTGDPQCSSAMSAWQNIRHGNPASMAIDVAMKILGKCRSKARALKQAGQQRTAGNEARAQALESRVAKGGPISAKDRVAKAREIQATREFRRKRDSVPQATRAAAMQTEIKSRRAVSKGLEVAKARELRAGRAAKPAGPGLIDQARAAAAKVPSSKRFGSEGKVFLHHAWAEYRKGGGKLGLSEFKGGLASNPDARLKLGMARADLVQAFRHGDIKGSNAKVPGAEFNFIRTGQAGSGMALTPRKSLYQPAPASERSRAAEVVAKVRASRAPAKPSLKEQAAAFRAGRRKKGAEEAKRILHRIANRQTFTNKKTMPEVKSLARDLPGAAEQKMKGMSDVDVLKKARDAARAFRSRKMASR